MSTDASAYAALGLEPGADSAAVEQAYKRLIKQHHPDREGGDAKRAAEINRAYRELRAAAREKDALEFNDHDLFGMRQVRGGWVRAALVIAVAVAALLIVTGPVAAYIEQLVPAAAPRLPRGQIAAAASAGDVMDKPLELAAVNRGLGDAVRISRHADEVALANASRNCHRRLQTDPTLAQLDRCAAFDDAVVQLQDRDPLRDRGPFSEVSVTGRQWSGAAGLSGDFLAIDSRLDRIRMHVELALAPPQPPPQITDAGAN